MMKGFSSGLFLFSFEVILVAITTYGFILAAGELVIKLSWIY